MIRPGWDLYFLNIAVGISARGECTRRQVGALLVSPSNRIVSAGYNGAPPGHASCLDGSCPRGLKTNAEVAPGSSYDTGAGSCIAIHAEANALLYASRADAEGGTLYITEKPCDGCLRLIKGSGVRRVVFRDSESGGFGEYGMETN